MDATKSHIICWCGRIYQILANDTDDDWDEQATGSAYHAHTDREGPPPLSATLNSKFGVALASGDGSASVGGVPRLPLVAVASGSGTATVGGLPRLPLVAVASGSGMATTSSAYLLNVNITLAGGKVWIKI